MFYSHVKNLGMRVEAFILGQQENTTVNSWKLVDVACQACYVCDVIRRIYNCYQRQEPTSFPAVYLPCFPVVFSSAIETIW